MKGFATRSRFQRYLGRSPCELQADLLADQHWREGCRGNYMTDGFKVWKDFAVYSGFIMWAWNICRFEQPITGPDGRGAVQAKYCFRVQGTTWLGWQPRKRAFRRL